MTKEQPVIKHEDKKLVKPIIYEAGKMPTETRTLGQKASDALTSKMGSWLFIILFLVVLVAWMIVNTVWIVFGQAWDPKPFIMLNLCLSCLAAIQAPIILMSQNRSDQKDRVRQEYDYIVDRHSLRQINKVYKELTYLRSDINTLLKAKKIKASKTKRK